MYTHEQLSASSSNTYAPTPETGVVYLVQLCPAGPIDLRAFQALIQSAVKGGE